MRITIYAEGPVKIYTNQEEAEKELKGKDGVIITIEGDLQAITIKPSSTKHEVDCDTYSMEGLSDEILGPDTDYPISIVLDQMFRGFSDTLDRELPRNVSINEILGKGLERPVRVGRIIKWPAHDDYDVFKIVEKLAVEGRKVIFFTGDKRLARQTAALGKDNIVVEYLPPNEFPGKEALIRKIISSTMTLVKS